MKSQFSLEFTGIFHLPLFCCLIESGFEVFVLNPLITHSNKNLDTRKVKNDKVDSIQIAKLGFNENIKKSVIPDAFVFNLRCLCREYFSLSGNKVALINKLSNNLRLAFSAIFGVFSSISSNTCLTFLNSMICFVDSSSQDFQTVITVSS